MHLLAFATFAFALRLRIGSSRGLGNLRFPSCIPFGSLPSCDHTRHTRNSCLRTSLTCLPCLSPCRLSCLPWSWQGRRHPWASLLTHARLLEGTFRPSVSVSQGTKPAQQGAPRRIFGQIFWMHNMCIDFQRFCTSSPDLWRTTRSTCSSLSMLAPKSE